MELQVKPIFKDQLIGLLKVTNAIKSRPDVRNVSLEINRDPPSLELCWSSPILLHASQTQWCSLAEICYEMSLKDHEEIDHLYKIMFFFWFILFVQTLEKHFVS